MKYNEKNKFIYLIMAIISISIVLSSTIMYRNLLISGAGSTSTNNIKNIFIANEYYLSRYFDDFLIPSLAKSLENSVSSDSKNKKVEQVRLDSINNIKFFVINKDTGVFYSNTEHKTEKDFNNYINDYCSIQILNGGRGYIKNINNKKIENYDMNGTRFNTSSKNIYMYATFPENLVDGDEVYESYYYYSKYKSIAQSVVGVVLVSLVIYMISILLYTFNKSQTYTPNINIPIELELFVIVSMSIILLKNINTISFSMSVFNGINIFVCIMICRDIIQKIKKYNGIYNVLKSCTMISILKKSIHKFRFKIKDVLLLKKILVVGMIAVVFNILGLYLDISYNKSIFVFLFSTISIILTTIYLIIRLSYLNHIMNSTNKIKNGRYDYKLKIKGNDNFTQLAENINNMGEYQNRVSEEKIINERLKLKFIYNASNAIKESVDNADIDQNQLKNLASEILELSNLNELSASTMTIDLVKAIDKKLNDKKQEVTDINLDFIINSSSEEVLINYTHNSINRILDKILDNIYRFSLDNTRVYIDIEKEDIKYKLTIKNISSTKINYNPDNLDEEYTRENIVQIAKSNYITLLDLSYLVRNNGGEISVKVDGDLFKLSIIF